MTHVFLNKDEISLAIRSGNTYEGDRSLIVSPAGEWRVTFVQKDRAWDPWGNDDQIFVIPPLFPDGSGSNSEEARECILTYRTMAFAHETMEEHGLSAIEYCEQDLPEEWQTWQEEGIERIAREFLLALNDEPNGLQDEFYDEHERRFVFHWAEDLPLSALADIVADVEGDDVPRVHKKLSARIAKGNLSSYLPDDYPVVRSDGKRGKVRMIPAAEVVRTVRMAELQQEGK